MPPAAPARAPVPPDNTSLPLPPSRRCSVARAPLRESRGRRAGRHPSVALSRMQRAGMTGGSATPLGRLVDFLAAEQPVGSRLRAATALLVLAAISVRCAIGLHPYSGMGKPPMFGDFEAQRHWMELTTSLPLADWCAARLPLPLPLVSTCKWTHPRCAGTATPSRMICSIGDLTTRR